MAKKQKKKKLDASHVTVSTYLGIDPAALVRFGGRTYTAAQIDQILERVLGQIEAEEAAKKAAAAEKAEGKK